MNVMRCAALCALCAMALSGVGCSSGDTMGGGGGGGADAGDEPWLHITASWSSLYEGYFGPAGVASCASGTTCHGAMGQDGVTASNFLCPNKDACYASLTGASNLVKPADVADPASAKLFKELRQTTGAGKMPSGSTFVFQPEDVALLKSWITKGAKDD